MSWTGTIERAGAITGRLEHRLGRMLHTTLRLTGTPDGPAIIHLTGWPHEPELWDTAFPSDDADLQRWLESPGNYLVGTVRRVEQGRWDGELAGGPHCIRLRGTADAQEIIGLRGALEAGRWAA